MIGGGGRFLITVITRLLLEARMVGLTNLVMVTKAMSEEGLIGGGVRFLSE